MNIVSHQYLKSSSSSSIYDRKRTLIEDFLTSSDDCIREFQIDDHAIEAIFDLLEHPERDIELFKSITKRLYNIYKTQDRELRLKTIIFLPTLIAIYVQYHHKNFISLIDRNKDNNEEESQDAKNIELESEPKLSIAILLMCVYNFEIINQKTGDLKTIDVRLVSLTKPSIYHEQSAHTTGQVSIPTEQMLAKINNPQESRITIFGPYHEIERINTGNQQSIFTVLMKIYNQHIKEAGYYSWQSMLRLYLNLLKQGCQSQKSCLELKKQIKAILNNDNHLFEANIKPELLQIQFKSEFLTEIMRAAYFCFYNELQDLAKELIDEICKRATYGLHGDVLLMINAFKNTQAIINRNKDDDNAKTQPVIQSDINTNRTRTVSSVSSRKTAITNASFKTKKLPDDIPIVVGPSNVDTNQLQSANNINAQKAQFKNSRTSLSSPSQPLQQQQQKQNGHQAFKSLDSINEEVLPNNNNNNNKSNNATNVKISAKPPRKGVINMLKELKDSSKQSKNKSSKQTSSVESNGKMLNSNHSSNTNNQDELIPMKQMKNLKKYIDDDEEDDNDEIVDHRSSDADSMQIINLNPPLAPLERFTDDDDEDGDDDEIDAKCNQNNGINHSNERFKLISEMNDHSSDVQSDRSSGASAVALLGNNVNQQNSNNGQQQQLQTLPSVKQQSNTSSMIKS